MEIRSVQPHEHQDAGRLVVEAYRSLPGQNLSDGYAEVLADVPRRAEDEAGAEVLVAVTEGELLGCVTFVPDGSSQWAELVEPGEAGIRMLAVRPRAQGRGAGRALVEACIRRAIAGGSEAVFLHSTPWMTAAHRLYEGLGFLRVPERDWVPAPGVPLLAYRLPLAGCISSTPSGG